MRAQAASFSLALLLFGGASHAQDTEAGALLREGASLRERNANAEALAVFERAYERCRCEEAMAQRAFAEQALGRWEDAAAHIERIDPSSSDPWVVARRRAIEAARERIMAAVGWLELRVTPTSARVWVGGRDRGVERRLRAARGEVAVRVEAPGYITETRLAQVAAGGTARVEIALLQRVEEPPLRVVPPPREVVRAPRAPSAAHPRLRGWAWAAGITAGLAVVGGGVALWAREESLARYNDASCVTAFASRDERCGAYREAAQLDEALAVTAGVFAGVSGIAALVLVLIDPADRGRERAMGCWQGSGGMVGCGTRF